MHLGCVLSAFHRGSSRWKPNLVTRLPHHSHHAAFHSGSPRWKRIWLPGTLLNQTKLPPRQARWRAAMWNKRRDLVAKRGFHPRKVDGVPGTMKQSYPTLRNDEQKWHNSKGRFTPVNSEFLTGQASALRLIAKCETYFIQRSLSQQCDLNIEAWAKSQHHAGQVRITCP